eukprot:scaffold3551_cov408-Prasinococcus_capsulatus_cf.AAC.18
MKLDLRSRDLGTVPDDGMRTVAMAHGEKASGATGRGCTAGVGQASALRAQGRGEARQQPARPTGCTWLELRGGGAAHAEVVRATGCVILQAQLQVDAGRTAQRRIEGGRACALSALLLSQSSMDSVRHLHTTLLGLGDDAGGGARLSCLVILNFTLPRFTARLWEKGKPARC